MVAPTRYRFTLDDWHRMGNIFGEDARVELIDGEIIAMSPIGSRHAGVVRHLTRLLVLVAGDAAEVAPQNPVEVDNWSEPQPDFSVVRPGIGLHRTPGAGDVLLVVEVADSSLAFDRRVKGPLYARAGIPLYWIVDVDDRSVAVLSDPSAEGYRSSERRVAGDRLAVADLGEIAVADIFGPD